MRALNKEMQSSGFSKQRKKIYKNIFFIDVKVLKLVLLSTLLFLTVESQQDCPVVASTLCSSTARLFNLPFVKSILILILLRGASLLFSNILYHFIQLTTYFIFVYIFFLLNFPTYTAASDTYSNLK